MLPPDITGTSYGIEILDMFMLEPIAGDILVFFVAFLLIGDAFREVAELLGEELYAVRTDIF